MATENPAAACSIRVSTAAFERIQRIERIMKPAKSFRINTSDGSNPPFRTNKNYRIVADVSVGLVARKGRCVCLRPCGVAQRLGHRGTVESKRFSSLDIAIVC